MKNVISFSELVYKALKKSMKLLPFNYILERYGRLLFLPFYHTVSNVRIPHISNIFPYCDLKHFERDLDFFQKHFHPISGTELLGIVKGQKKLSDRSLLLTFDDGYREIYDIIVPALKKRSFPAVFFLNSSTIDNRAMLYRNKASLILEKINKNLHPDILNQLVKVFSLQDTSIQDLRKAILGTGYRQGHLMDKAAIILGIDIAAYLEDEKPYLTSTQIQGLLDEGFMIGAHSIDHPHFKYLTLDEQLEQTLGSMKVLKDQFLLKYNLFAFPHNDRGVSFEFFEHTHFNGQIDISFGTAGFKDGYCANNLQRQSMEIRNMDAISIYRSGLLAEVFSRNL